MNDEQMAKALKELIDETITEIEDLKKSDRFSASEVKIEGPGEGLAGKPTNGELDASKADDKDEDKEDDKKDKKEESCEKGVLDEAEKSEDVEKKEDDKEDDKKEDKEDDKKEDKKEDKDDKKEDKEDKAPWMKSVEEVETLKKSVEAQEELMKSYIDSKIAPIENKMSDILNAIKEISDTPVERKSVPSNVQPFTKSVMDGPEPLNKSEVIDKMLELKKNGQNVPTDDITRAELGSPADLDNFVTKYQLTRD